MANLLGRINNRKPRAIKPTGSLHPVKVMEQILRDSKAVDSASGGALKTGDLASEILDTEWDNRLGKMGRGVVARKVNTEDFLRDRYYGDALDQIVADAEANRLEGKHSFFHPENSPLDRMKEPMALFRTEGDLQETLPGGKTRDVGSAAVPHVGSFSSYETLKRLTDEGLGTTDGIESAHRGVEAHETSHGIEQRKPVSPFGESDTLYETLFEFDDVTTDTPRNREVRESLLRRVGPEQLRRIEYAQQQAELLANMGMLKRYAWAERGEVPRTREGAREFFDEMADEAEAFDLSDPDFRQQAMEQGYGFGKPWDFYGPDPKGEYGPMKGKSLRGATETRMNLGNIFLEADPETQDMLIETFLRSVDNNDIRKSLLARTA